MKSERTYRINGFEQIKAFYSWVFNNPDKSRPTHISLYLFLINQANRANWAEWFKCPYDLAMQGACIGNNGTYYRCLDDLKMWNLIDYKKGINNYKAPLIKLICLYNNEQVTEQVTVPLSEQQTVQQTVQLTEQLPAHIYKLLTNNIKLITDNIEAILKFLEDKNGICDNKNIEARETVFLSEVWQYKEQYPEAILKAFINYWTEKNRSKTKMRFETEKTFEISRRLSTWASRDKSFTKTEEPVKLSIRTGEFSR